MRWGSNEAREGQEAGAGGSEPGDIPACVRLAGAEQLREEPGLLLGGRGWAGGWQGSVRVLVVNIGCQNRLLAIHASLLLGSGSG